MDDCVFCKIIRGEVPTEKVYEDEKTLAFLNILPNSLGHTLVIPKDHFENIYETPDEVISNLAVITKKISIAVKKAVQAEGINIISNNEPAAGQVVFHTHTHIIPRYKGDGYEHWLGKKRNPEEMLSTGNKIRKEIN